MLPLGIIIQQILGLDSGGTILVHDTFTGTQGTAADSRAPDIGPTPVVLRDGTNGGVWQINNNNELERTTAATWSYLTYDTGTNYDVEISASVQPQINGVQGSTYIVARFQDNNNWVGVGFFQNTINIYEKIGGTLNQRATKGYTYSTAQTYFVKMVLNGSTCEMWVNGVKELETTGLTTHITNSAKHGFYCWYDQTGNKVYDNLLITSGTPSSLLHGLVSWWTLDEVSGTRSDSHGTNTLTDNNTVGSTTGVFGNAADFVKANSESLSVAAGHNLESGARDFSFALHYTPTTITQYDGVVSCGTGALANQHEYVLQIIGGKLAFYVPFGGTWYWAQSTVTLVAGTTYHVYCQYDNTTKKCGISVNHETLVETATNTPALLGGGFYLGYYFGYQYGDCKIDEPAFWARKLTTAERLEHQAKTYSDLTAGPQLLTDLVSWLDFEEASGNFSDSHGSNDGTPTGMLYQSVAPSQAGFAAESDTNSDIVTFGSASGMGGTDRNFTVAALVYQESGSGTHPHIAWNGSSAFGSGSNESWMLGQYENGQARFSVMVGASYPQALSTTFGNTSLQNWYLICGFHDADNSRIGVSVNGGAIDWTSLAGTINNGSAWDVNLCKSTDYSANTYFGRYAFYGFWDRLLTQEETRWLWNGGKGRTFSDI